MKYLLSKIKAVILSIITVFTALFGGAPEAQTVPKDPEIITGISDDEYFEKYFEPIFRFVVASDAHFDGADSETEEERLAMLYKTAYKYAALQKYNKIDGAFFAGDISDSGDIDDIKRFYKTVYSNCLRSTTTRTVLGNHDFLTYGPLTVSRYLEASGYETLDADIVLGGYHFIFLSPSVMGVGYSLSQIKWLDRHLSEAVNSDPTGSKPVFVFQHQNIKDTVYGSNMWGISTLTGVLEKYPQVVDFSGHSHYPIGDPRSIWQGSFTALGTGSLSYYEMGIAGVIDTGIFPSDTEGGYALHKVNNDAAQYYIVEISKENSLLIKGFDIFSETFICEYRIRLVGNPEAFDYTDERKEESLAPVFSEDAVITPVSIKALSAEFSVPQAVSCGDPVQHYRFEAYLGNLKVATSYSLADTFYYPTPETIKGSFSLLLPNTDYTIKCYAVNCWEKESEPLVLKIHTK